MANTNVTMRIDETLKVQLQELLSNLGIDMTTFFTMAAKQAVREQALPFKPNMNTGAYGLQAYKLAIQSSNYNKEGKATISSDDEWNNENEWDDMFKQTKKEKCTSQNRRTTHQANLLTYFKYPKAVHHLIYTTNAIEGFNCQLRKITKSKTVFSSDDSLLKMLYLAMIDITPKWTGHRQDWGQIHSQLEIFFEERLS